MGLPASISVLLKGIKRGMKKLAIILLLAFIACKQQKDTALPTLPIVPQQEVSTQVKEMTLVILGVAQDGGAPHIGCKKDCCKDLLTTLQSIAELFNNKKTCKQARKCQTSSELYALVNQTKENK